MGTVTRVLADSVRLALPSEAAVLAALQRRVWVADPTPQTQGLLQMLDLMEMTKRWESAILRPPLAQYRVLVAIGQKRVVGFAALGPSDDPDAEPGADALVAEFLIDPAARQLGHGSRLLNAAMDTLRADGFSRATWWLRADQDRLRAFLASAGWAPDGAHAEMGTEESASGVKMVRLHTSLAEPGQIRTTESGPAAR